MASMPCLALIPVHEYVHSTCQCGAILAVLLVMASGRSEVCLMGLPYRLFRASNIAIAYRSVHVVGCLRRSERQRLPDGYAHSPEKKTF